MSNNTATATASAGFPTLGILTIIFVVAKLFNLISWSWWLVFAPLWAPLALILTVVGGFFLVMALATVVVAMLD